MSTYIFTAPVALTMDGIEGFTAHTETCGCPERGLAIGIASPAAKGPSYVTALVANCATDITEVAA